jgi:hypothetical protein
MRAIAAGVSLGLVLVAAGARSQNNTQNPPVSSTQAVPTATSPDYSAVYCSNFVSSENIANDLRLISGEQSDSKITFATRDFVYISKGANQGIHVGDRFSVIRPIADPVGVDLYKWQTNVQWFKWQNKLLKAMGTVYQDTGQLKVVNVQPNVSIAEVTFTCVYMQRGDIVRPMQDRPSPPFKPATVFDHFAPASGKSVGMLVSGKDFSNVYGKFNTVYVNLGTNQGVTVGQYLRVFRYQGSNAETAVYYSDYQYKIFGFGSTPQAYKWNDLPREVLGEGIVLNVSPNASTILITYSRSDLWAGDYAEIE